MKKLFISADLEGVSGVSSWEETRFGGRRGMPPADPRGRRGLPRSAGAGIYGIGQRRS